MSGMGAYSYSPAAIVINIIHQHVMDKLLANL